MRNASAAASARDVLLGIVVLGESPPPEEAIDESIEVPLEHCPECGCGLQGCHQQVIEQTLIELPPISQQKCHAHHLKAISQALNTPSGSRSLYLLEVRGLRHLALVLNEYHDALSDTAIASFRRCLEERADQLLWHPRGDPDDSQRQ